MQLQLSLVALLSAAYLLHISFAEIVPVTVAKDENEERIVGGRSAEQGQFPWACALHFNGQFICTCSILGPKTVMTAAHCVNFNGVIPTAGQFHAIANYNKSETSQRIDFAAVAAHPAYDSDDDNINNDIALLETENTIEFNDDVKPICIPRPNTPHYEYKYATAMGWGNVSPIRIIVIIPEILQYVEQKIIHNRLCSLAYGEINDDKLCATGLFNGICNGDSGGPLVAQAIIPDSSETFPVQIGIASYINGLAGCGKIIPGVWTRVSSHYDYIMQNAADGGAICSM